ncbi:MAG: PEP/pyruvate-binding domain-containing protein [Candidatus Brocadiia bacterium]
MSSTQPRKWVYFFGGGTSEGEPARTDLLGGKGAGLAAMSRAGLPVPPGFTISAECCPFVLDGEGWPPGLEDQVRRAMACLEEHTGRPFGQGPRPLLVAVRSGAAVSMPGMMDTVLNCGLTPALAEQAAGPPQFWRELADHVRAFARCVAGLSLEADAEEPEAAARQLLDSYQRHTGEPFPAEPWEALRRCIDAVFASWASERAAAYRRQHGVPATGTAVNVQAMFPSQRAGVLFTANPNDPEAGEMVLEASWGLGEAVVSGSVSPDVAVLDARTLEVRRTTPGERPEGPDVPALSPDEVRAIAELGRQVESHFGHPCDIEWGLAEGRVALLQSRPIRGLEALRQAEAVRRNEVRRLGQLADDERVVWAEHNLAETLPAPTPLTWDIVRRFMSGSGGFGLMYRDFGYRPTAEVCERGFLELICGRIYTDPRRAAGLFWDRVPLAYEPEEVLRDPSVLDSVPRKLHIEKADPVFFLRVPALVWGMLRAARRMRKARADAVAAFEQRAVPRLRRLLDEVGRDALSSRTTEELLAELDRRRRAVLDDFGKESLKPGFFGGLAQQALERLLVQAMGEEEGGDFARRLTTGLEHDTTVEQNVLLYRVARGEATLAQFLARYGHRAVGEMELAQPRWREEPSYVERMIESLRRPGAVPPAERHARQAAQRRKAEAELPDRLAHWGAASLLERIRPQMADAQRLLPYRERAKHFLMMGYETVRAVLVELARRWGLGRDLFFLRLNELGRFEAERGRLLAAIEARKRRWAAARRLSPPAVVDSADLDGLGRPRPPAEGERLEGRPLAPGSARGPARVVLDPREAGDLGTGYILVCPSTDPGWAPLFVRASGLVVERGGVLSHGAIVARDFGIPAVAVRDATQAIPQGARVAVDGHTGAVVLAETVPT